MTGKLEKSHIKITVSHTRGHTSEREGSQSPPSLGNGKGKYWETLHRAGMGQLALWSHPRTESCHHHLHGRSISLKCVMYLGNLLGVWEHQNPSIIWTGRQITKARYDRGTSPGEEIDRSSFLVGFPNACYCQEIRGWLGWLEASKALGCLGIPWSWVIAEARHCAEVWVDHHSSHWQLYFSEIFKPEPSHLFLVCTRSLLHPISLIKRVACWFWFFLLCGSFYLTSICKKYAWGKSYSWEQTLQSYFNPAAFLRSTPGQSLEDIYAAMVS